jgi:hypothetical protein
MKGDLRISIKDLTTESEPDLLAKNVEGTPSIKAGAFHTAFFHRA